MNIVGKGFTIPEFKAYVDGLKFNGWTPSFVVVHNTSAPDLKLWHTWQTRAKPVSGEQWMRNLKGYYEGMGWNAGPHLFVAPDKIWVLTPLTQRGTHSPAWNSFSWGVETVGEFEREAFEGTPTQTNLVAALAILHDRIGLNPADYKKGVRGLHFHKEDPKTTHKTCPGKKIVKSKLVADVVAAMHGQNPGSHVHISAEAATAELQTIETPKQIQEKLNQWMESKPQGWDKVVFPAKLDAKVKKEALARQKSGWVPLVVDGDIGTKTKAAVAIFQAVRGLKLIDGIAGPLTRLELDNVK